MRDQYVGDVSDALKFAFLRALAGPDKTLGVAWYYVPENDGRPDGRHVEWRDEPAWRTLDAELYAGLAALPERSIAALERSPIWRNGTLFHSEPVPPQIKRDAWSRQMQAALGKANLVFLDPDNGLTFGRATQKHATFSEIELLWERDRAIVFITFPGRSMPHDSLWHRLHEQIHFKMKAKSAFTLRTTTSVPRADDPRYYVPRQRWFTVVDPGANLIGRARAFATALATVVPRTQVSLVGID